MTNIAQLLTEHMAIWTAADTEKKSGRGRASGNASSVYGVKKLRELILELAVRGKLVPQDTLDASESLKYSKLGDIVEVLDSLRKPVTKQDRLEGPYPYYGASGIVDFVSTYIFDEPLVLIGEDGAKWGVGENTAFAINGKTWVNNHAHVIRPNREVVSDEYLTYCLVAMDLNEFITGMTVPKLNQARLVSIMIPLPSLAKQQRIVAKVDELMALCDQLEQQHSNAQEVHETLVSQLLATLTQSQNAAEFNANWQRIYAHFDVLFTTEASIDNLKQTLLQLAVMGKLVPQDPNDEPASELLKRIQAEKAKLIAEGKLKKEKPISPAGQEEKPFVLPMGWIWERLGNITNFGMTEKLNHISNETWVLDLEDIEKDTSRIIKKNRFSEKQSLSDKNSFRNGDILYGKLRPYLNKVVIADEDGVCTTEILPIRCYGPFDNKYFMYALKAPYFIEYVNARSYGMKMPRLGTDDGRNSLFPLAPLAEQHRIVAKVDALMALCDQLKTRITDANLLQHKLADVLVKETV